MLLHEHHSGQHSQDGYMTNYTDVTHIIYKKAGRHSTNLHALSIFREEESANHVLKRLVSFSGSGLAALDNK